MKIITLENFTEERFLRELENFKNNKCISDQRNADWFDRIPQIYKSRFEEWFFLVDEDDSLVAFATIQKFYDKCYRLLTRTYYNPLYRRKHILYEKNVKTPAMYILDAQLEFLQDYDTLFISMQDLKRRPALKKVKDKIGNGWKLHPKMIQTCNEIDSKNCWQNVIFIGQELKLPSISISEWHKLQ